MMKDGQGKILYIGKSVNLRHRVASYFQGGSLLNFGKKSMVSQVHDIEVIPTISGTEALVLETNLIKSHLPKYNIFMKDDKNLAYLEILP